MGAAYLVGLVVAAGGHEAFASAPNQLHLIGLGSAGGIFGAAWSHPLKALFWPDDEFVPSRHKYGLTVMSSIAGGLLLPRFTLAMDAAHLKLWDCLATLS